MFRTSEFAFFGVSVTHPVGTGSPAVRNGRAGRRRYALARPNNWVRNVTEQAATQALRSRERIPTALQRRLRSMPLGTLLVGVGNA